MQNFCIAVTGMPGSGKSTAGKQVAEKLDFAFLDKDEYLETLFEDKGTGDLAWRQKLSRESDELFQRDAESHKSVVLVSHWRPRGCNTTSGTPVEWLAEKFSQIVELYCSCPIEEAATRFIGRDRHPGHLDRLKTRTEILQWLAEYQGHLPLSLGKVEVLDTGSGKGLDEIGSILSQHVKTEA